MHKFTSYFSSKISEERSKLTDSSKVNRQVFSRTSQVRNSIALTFEDRKTISNSNFRNFEEKLKQFRLSNKKELNSDISTLNNNINLNNTSMFNSTNSNDSLIYPKPISSLSWKEK